MHLQRIALFAFLVYTYAETIESENLKRNVSGFLFTMPKTLLSGKNETVCLSTHYSSPSPIKILVDLKIKEQHIFTTRTLQSEHSCFALITPESFTKEPQFVSVRVQVQLNGTIFYAHNQDPILLYPNHKVTFVETDKNTYKSQDKVRIRVLTLDHNLLPPLNYKIPYIRIRNPLGLGVVVWENVSTELGLAQLEHQLSQDPVEGKWKLEVNGETRIFEVSKYILPRFKVDIVHPKTIYYKSVTVTMKVCAKYSYGGRVKGIAFIKLFESSGLVKPSQALKKMTNGCAEFIFSNEELSLSVIKKSFPMIEPKIQIHITATVTEYGTDKIEITTSKTSISFKPYDMKISRKSLLLPGLVYQGALQINNIETDLRGEVVQICYNIAIRKSWNYLNNEQCLNITLQNENSIKFNILPLKNHVIHVQLNARSLNHSNIADSLLLVRLYSASSSYLTLEKISSTQLTKCKTNQQFSIQYTADQFRENENVVFYYVIKTRTEITRLGKIHHSVHKQYINYFSEYNNILGTKHKHVKTGASIGKFVLKFKLDDNIISNYWILVYYITHTGEVISTSKEVQVEPCLNNKVEANWSHKQISPGSTAALLIETKTDSLCSISAIDKSVKFMDDFSTLNAASFLKPFLKEREPAESGRKSCIPPSKKNREASALTEELDALWNLKRKKRYVYSFSEDYDAYDIFSKFGAIAITNFRVITKPCFTGPIPPTSNPVQSLTDQYDTQNDDTIASIRSYFPETWLWELVPVRGAAVIHRNLPHTITSWLTNILCVSSNTGVGFSKTIEISSYQPFFVDVLTPHSIKRGETLYLHVVVFNYLNYNIPIKINLGTSDNLKVIDNYNRKGVSYCVLGNSTVTHIFDIKAQEAGNANVTVLSEIESTYPGQCGPDVVVHKRDVVFKTLVVEPEGHQIKITKSALLCVTDSYTLSNVTWDITIPAEVVPKTTKSKIILNGDILGPTIANLEDLIVMPSGCGEQIMANLVPNLYILEYLNATGDLTPTLKRRIFRNLKIGYQRILNYVHKDGSFSAFGYHDPMGSMFLTAFVVRTLQEVKQYIYVDQRAIDRGVAWILSHQLENGCFNTMLHVFQDMGGTTIENSTAALTSYVMISLIDSNIDIPEPVKTNAKYCIRGYYQLDKYTLAISSYALFKINWYSEAHRMLKKLFQTSNTEDNMMWWVNKVVSGSTASDVEVTSYVLLSLLHQRSQENLAKAHSIVRWLTTKLGPKGSFRSTQDTVVALDALTRYSQFINSREVNMDVTIEATEQHQTIKMGSVNILKSKKIVLKNPNRKVKIRIEGQGCILAQIITSYYVKELLANDAFKLDMEIMPVSNIDPCSIATLSPCFTYTGPDLQTNMAILEVDLPSGYEADRVSLYKLINGDTSKKVKMFEELQQKVILYITKLDSQQICINFNINENAVVESRSDSLVKLYDYYKPEYSILQFYKIGDKCKLKNQTIPQLGNGSILLETEKNVSKRDVLNPEFVVLNEELEEPSGEEGPKPVYMKPNSSTLRAIDNSTEKNS